MKSRKWAIESDSNRTNWKRPDHTKRDFVLSVQKSQKKQKNTWSIIDQTHNKRYFELADCGIELFTEPSERIEKILI